MSTDNDKTRAVAAVEHKSTAQLREDAAHARVALADTLDAIEYKLNVPKQVRITGRRITLGLHRLGEENPPALAGIALGAAVVVGTTVWWGVTAVLNRR
jgi:hypothetical protein